MSLPFPLAEMRYDLTRQGRWFAAIADAAQDLVYAFDPHGRVTYANPALLAAWGCSAVQGRSLVELGYPAEVAETIVRQVRHVVTTGEAVRDEGVIPEPLPAAGISYDYILSPVFSDSGAVEAVVGIARETTERQRFQRQLGESEARYKSLFESMDEGFCVIEVLFNDSGRPVDYRFLEVNPAFARQTGLVDAEGRRMRELAPEHEAHWFETYGHVARTGEPLRFEQRAQALNRWYDVYAYRVGAPEQCRVAVLFNDISKRKHDEERQTLLMREIDHRSRNMLAIIQALVNLTAASKTDMPEFVAAVQARIAAMSHAQDLIARRRWQGASLRALIHDPLSAYTAEWPGALVLEGPDLVLRPEAAMGLSMVIHELATNAAKYGALSSPEGRVVVRWRREPDGDVALEWQERGGPPIREAPRRKGFGSTLITASLAGGIGGSARLRFELEGLTCSVRLPAGHVAETLAANGAVAAAAAAPEISPPQGAVARILVVEDQPLIALEAKQAIEAAGYEVIGPAYTLEDALFVAKTEPIDAALLDVDIGGQPVYIVADILRARHIPFVFVSGFRSEALVEAYRGHPVLSKPLRPTEIARALQALAA